MPTITGSIMCPNADLLSVAQTDANFNVMGSRQIRKIAGCACARNAGNVFPRHSRLAIPKCITAAMHAGIAN